MSEKLIVREVHKSRDHVRFGVFPEGGKKAVFSVQRRYDDGLITWEGFTSASPDEARAMAEALAVAAESDPERPARFAGDAGDVG